MIFFSSLGESVPLKRFVNLEYQSVESWLLDLEKKMQQTIKQLLSEALGVQHTLTGDSLFAWPMQITMASNQIVFTNRFAFAEISSSILECPK